MREALFVDSRKTPANHEVERVPLLPVVAQLVQREGKEGKDRRSSGQGLANRGMERGLVAARQDELPCLTALVNPSLKIGQEFGSALDLVEDGAGGECSEENLWDRRERPSGHRGLRATDTPGGGRPSVRGSSSLTAWGRGASPRGIRQRLN